MADYILTEKAEEDFDDIGLYSLDRWGLKRAESYLSDLDSCFGRLANDLASADTQTQFQNQGFDVQSEVTLCGTGSSCRADQVISRPGANGAQVPDGYTATDLNGNQLDVIPLNSNGQPVTGVNAISSTHAEIDALNQIQQRGINVSGQNLSLHVDRPPCTACDQNGGIRSMVEQLGLNQLTVISPDGPLIVRPR